MYRIDDPSASATLPTPEAALTEGYWTEGNPGTGTPATLERASWFNMVQEELRAIPVAAGLTPSKTTYNQILTALKSMFASVVGSMRGAKMNTSAGVTSATVFTAAEIIVETALGGQTYRLANYSQTINLATTGAGGMDTGTAPVSGYVALYAIYNPTTQTASILATNATSTVQPNVYGGANMPAGYTASALISVWPTNGSKLFVVGLQSDRSIAVSTVTALSSSTTQATPTALSITAAVPPNASAVSGTIAVASTVASNISLSVIPAAALIGIQGINTITGAASASNSSVFRNLQMGTLQTMYYIASNTAGTPTFTISVTGYDF